MRGRVFSIEEFSVYDGPGIRTTVFLKGCPLRCSWCHNPEGQSAQREVVRSANGCVHCGMCEKYAEHADGRIRYTEESISHCPRHLLRESGKDYTPEELVSLLLKNEEILKNGGITFSGGEPLMQHEFVLACFSLLEGRLHRALQTSGYCEPSVFRTVAERTDYFLFDIKLLDEREHIRYVGASNRNILENFRYLASSGKNFTVRVPLIPSVTDTEENTEAIAVFLQSCSVSAVELMPYNKLAGSKYALVGRTYTPDFDPTVPVCLRTELFEHYGIEASVL